MPPVAKMVTLGSDALMAVWISWRTKSRCSPDLVRSMGEATAREAKSGSILVKLFILMS